MLNGMTGCVQALRLQPKRRWLLDGGTRQPQDTQRTQHSERLVTPAEAAASDAALKKKKKRFEELNNTSVTTRTKDGMINVTGSFTRHLHFHALS